MQYDEAALQQVRETRLLIDRCDAWLFETIQPYLGSRVLEIGCGLGNLTRHLLDRDLVVGVDIDQRSINFVLDTYGSRKNVEAYSYDASDPAILSLGLGRFDTVVSLNVFEHIEDDLAALDHVRKLLEPDGRFVLIVPSHMFLYGTMDSSIGHYRRYDIKCMTEKLNSVGLAPIEQRYLNPLGALGWLLNGRVFRRKVPPIGQLKIFNRIMPLVETAERLIDAPFGLSLLSVSRRVQ